MYTQMKGNKALLKKAVSFLIVLCMMVSTIFPLMTIIASAAAPSSYTTITADSTASVNISSAGTAKYFKFVPTQSGTYKFYSSAYTADPYGALLDANGSTLTSNDDDGDERNFSITYNCTANTTYYIKAYLYSSTKTGTYTLNVQTVSVVTPTPAFSYTTITADSTASVSISSSGSAKYFKFVPTASGTYRFYSTSYSGDPKGALLDENNIELISDDDDVDNNFKFTYDCTANTTYYIKAYMYGSRTGSYTLNVKTVSAVTPPVTPPAGDVVNVNAAGGTNYPLFNSGRTGDGYKYSSTSNPDESSYTNNGYDLYANMSEANEIIQLGLPFVVGVAINEQATVNIYAYDVDEHDTHHGHVGDERDYIYLVNETTGARTKLNGYLSGQNETWNNTSLTISPNLLKTGNTYHFELDADCTCGCSTYWVVYVRTVNLIVNGASEPPVNPTTGIENADLSASISSSGLISVDLTAKAYASESYTLEYKAVCAADNAQYGGKQYSVTIPTTSAVFDTTFQLESGAPRGTYEITVFIKNSAGTVVATRSDTASYGYSAVSYNANGGSQNLPTDGTTYSSGNTVTVKFDYVPSLYGYTFLGWSTDRTDTTPMYTENGTKTFTIGSSDVTLYAIWAPIACEHNWNVSTRDATCTADGKTVKTCSICGDVEETVIPALGHNYVSGECSRCGAAEPSVDVWDGTVDTSWYNSASTEFTIYTAEQLAGLAQLVNNGNTFSGKTIYLGNNIDLAEHNWSPIGNETHEFSGTFNGNKNIIYNMTITGRYRSAGLFGYTLRANISNIGLENVSIDVNYSGNTTQVGALIGGQDNGTVSNCYMKGSVACSNNDQIPTGGLIGVHYSGVVRNCYAISNVTITSSIDILQAGGLIGVTGWHHHETVKIENCFAVSVLTGITTSNLSLRSGMGGLVGDNYATSCTVSNCFVLNCNITSRGNKGAIYGSRNESFSLTRCYYANTNASDSFGGTSTNTSNLQSQSWIATNLGWDFDTVWEFRAGSDYPVLQGFGDGGNTPHTHDFEETSRTQPTCTADGSIHYACSCGETKTDVIPALGHNYVSGECSRCGDTRRGKVLLIEDTLPWGYNTNSVILQRLVDQGKIEAFEKHSSSELARGSVDMDDYALVILAADQDQSFYNNIPIEALAAYAQNGGSVFLAADTRGATSGKYSVFPFGITSTKETDRNNYIVDQTHPMITGIHSDNHILQNSDMYGQAMSHNYFTNYPQNTNVILRDSSSRATLIEFEYGLGLVVVSGLTFECGYQHDWSFAQGYDDIFVHLYNHSSYAPHTHDFEETSRTEPTCTADGRINYACSCGQTKVGVIPALGHNYVRGACSRCGAAEPSVDVWDGTVDTSWYNSASTEFTIYTAEQLAGLAQLVNNGNTFRGKTIYLGINIDLAGREWTPIGKGISTSDTYSSSKSFSGTFDGAYHTISNLTISSSTTSFTGFFGCLYNGASVLRLGIENASVTATGISDYRCTAGILAGASETNVTISNCYTTGQLTVRGNSSYLDIGCLIGDCYDATVTNCYANATVVVSTSDGGHVGGLFGYFHSTSTVRYCLFVGTITETGTNYDGAIHSDGNSGTLTYCYYNSNKSTSSATRVSDDDLLDQASFSNLDFANVWTMGEEHPILQGFDESVPHTHDFEETSRTEPTCTADGRINYACSCGQTKVGVIPALGHNIQTTIETEVSCTTDGLIVDRCTNNGCDYEKRTVIHGEHDYEITDREDAACETPGYIEYTCSICGDEKYEYFDGAHNYVESERVEPQVGVEGSITYTCTLCHDSYEVTLPALTPISKNSSVLLIQDSLPWAQNVNRSLLESLKERGVVSSYNIINTSALASFDLTQYGVVFIANDQTTAMYERLAANGQKLEAYVRAGGNLVYGACDEGWGGSGSLTHTLPGGVTTSNYYSVHNYIVNGLHPVVTGVNTDNRSLRDELLKGNYCSHTYFNKATLPAGTDIILRDANGNPTLVEYTLGEGTVIASGLTWEYFYVRDHYNMVTNYSKYAYDDLLTYMVYMSNTCEHDYELVETVDATCEENGYTRYVCTLCSHEYMGDIVIAPGHTHVETSRTDGSCLVMGQIVYTCHCGNVKVEETGYADHTPGAWIVDVTATCLPGSRHKECTVCEEVLETEEIPAVDDHIASGWIVDTAASCMPGSKHKECTVCEEILATEEIPAVADHVASDWIVDVAPTATQTGSRHKECTVCDAILETEVMPILAKLVIESMEAEAGKTVSVTIDIQNNPGIIGALLTIQYDPSLTLIGAEAGSAWSTLNFTKPQPFANPCNFVWDGVIGADHSNGSILVLTFRLPTGVETGTVLNISASYTSGNIIDENLEAFDLAIENGSITIVNTIGDVNDDGVVDVADVIVLRRYLASGYNVTIDEFAADMDDDGSITVADVVLLRRFLVG